jgi:hypothetical protein
MGVYILLAVGRWFSPSTWVSFNKKTDLHDITDILLKVTLIPLTENCENRNDPDLVQAFLKKWWVESDFKAPNLPLFYQK